MPVLLRVFAPPHAIAFGVFLLALIIGTAGAIAGPAEPSLSANGIVATGLRDPDELAPPLDPEDISHRQVLEALMSSLFLKKGDSWFTQSIREATPAPYEFKGLTLSGPTSLVVTKDDKREDIDRRLSFGFSVSAHRRFDKISGWQPWVKGKPPFLTGIIMNRVDGLWVIASSPKDSFSVK